MRLSLPLSITTYLAPPLLDSCYPILPTSVPPDSLPIRTNSFSKPSSISTYRYSTSLLDSILNPCPLLEKTTLGKYFLKPRLLPTYRTKTWFLSCFQVPSLCYHQTLTSIPPFSPKLLHIPPPVPCSFFLESLDFSNHHTFSLFIFIPLPLLLVPYRMISRKKSKM